MKGSEESYTIIVFRGARANPVRLKFRKSIVKRSLIGAACLLAINLGIFTHYVIQQSQLSELHGLRQELSSSHERTSSFASEVDSMKKRMMTLELLNRKLQTMFGLEPDKIEKTPNALAGKGGEEWPFEGTASGAHQMGMSTPGGSGHAPGKKLSNAERQFLEIQVGLRWLERQSHIEQTILNSLAKTASQRANQWARTPSIWPVKGHITSKFGPRLSPFTGKKAMHAGLDIGAKRGTEVRAPAAGKVVVAAYETRMGKFVRIDHGFGIESTYGHLSKIHVKYGTKVKRGDLIGLVGSSGRFSTGPHLHYQLAVNDRVVDPLQYILD